MGCKEKEKARKSDPCPTCKQKNDIVADLAAGLVRTMESAKTESKKGSKGPSQSGSNQPRKATCSPAFFTAEERAFDRVLKYRVDELNRCTQEVLKDTRGRVADIHALVKEGLKDIRGRVAELHTQVKTTDKNNAGGKRGNNGGHMEERGKKPALVCGICTTNRNPLQRSRGASGANRGEAEKTQENENDCNGWYTDGEREDEAQGPGRDLDLFLA